MRPSYSKKTKNSKITRIYNRKTIQKHTLLSKIIRLWQRIVRLLSYTHITEADKKVWAHTSSSLSLQSVLLAHIYAASTDQPMDSEGQTYG